jgi:hypothetical protein
MVTTPTPPTGTPSSHADLVLESMLAFKADMAWAMECLELLSLGVPVGGILLELRSVCHDDAWRERQTPTWHQAMAEAKKALGEDAWQVNLCTYALRHQWGLPQPTYERRLQKDALAQGLSWLVTGEAPSTPQ